MNDFEKITALKEILYKHSMLVELKKVYQQLVCYTFNELYSCLNFNKKDSLKKFINCYTESIQNIDKQIENIQNEVEKIIK
jgi:hypothetical protein